MPVRTICMFSQAKFAHWNRRNKVTSFEVDKEELNRYYMEGWEEANKAYDASSQSFYDAWWWLCKHPIFNTPEGESYFKQTLDIDIVKVDDAGIINKNDSKNIHDRIWLECGPVYLKSDAPDGFLTHMSFSEDALGVVSNVHDYKLDCAGESFELAILNLARLVKTHYGTNRSYVYRDR